MKTTARLVVLSCLALVLAAPLAAQDWKGKGRLQGKVVDPGGQGYAGFQGRHLGRIQLETQEMYR